MPSLYPIHHRLKAIAAVIVTAVMAVTCDLVTSPESGSTIRVSFVGTGGGAFRDSIVVHQPVTLTIAVTDQNNVPLEGVTLELVSLSPDTLEVIPPSLPGGAFSIEAKHRGRVRIRARLLGSAFADNPPTADTVIVGIVSGVAIEHAAPTIQFANLFDSVTLRGIGLDGLGARIDSTGARWSSSDQTIATVDSVTGVVTSVGNGSAVITATLDRRTDQISVTVSQILRSYTFSPAAIVLTSLGQTRQVTVTPRDGAGNPIPANVALPAPAFTSSNAGRVSVASSGNTATLTALTNGPVDVRAVGGAADDTLSVIVSQEAKTVVIGQGEVADTIDALSETLQLLATVRDTFDVALPANLPVTWLSNNPAIATVDAAGVVLANAVGQATIIALRAPAADTITIVVRNIPRRVGLTETIAFPTVGDTVQAQDTVTNSRGAVVPGAVVQWRSVDSTIAAVTATGRVIARAIGTTKVVGTINPVLGCFGGNCADTIAVTVANEPTSVSIAAAALTLNSIGDTVTAISTILNARNAALPRSAVTWISGNPNVATVSNDGLIQAVSAGATQVIATVPSGNDADTVAVTVTNAPASLTLNRTRDTLTAPTSTLQYQASVRNAAAALIPGASITFTSTKASAASVSGSGLATQNAQFLDSTLIIAEVSGAAGTRADTAVLVVRNDAVTVVLDRTQASIGAINDTAHFRATALNSANQAVPGVQFTWNTANPLVATVSATGIVTAVGIGNTTVSARITVGVLASVPTPISVTNAPATIVFDSTGITLRSVGDTLTTTGVYQNRLGITLSRTAAAWSSDGAGIATVSPDGIVTAVGRGTTKIRARSPLPGSQTEDSLFVTVTNAPASINVLPDSVSTMPSLGRTLSFSADVFNARGGQIPGEPVGWVSRNTGIATVSAAGVVTSVDTGSVFIVGSATGPSGTVRDSARVIVRNLASEVEFSPASVSFASLGNRQLVTITARNEQGNPIPNSLVTWTASNTASVRFRTTLAGPAVVGPVVTRDTVTIEAIATGSATLSATVDGVTNSIGVSVSNPPATVQITSGNLTMGSVNDTVVPSVNFLNASGGALPRNAVLWTTGNPNVATATSNGDVVATGAGTATITAASPVNAALTSSITVTVTNAPIAVALNTTNNTLTALGRTLPYVATVRNARNAVITSPSLLWSSNNGAVASVDPATGLATANAVGGPVTITATASSTVGPLVQASANASLSVTNFAVSLDLSPNVDTILNLTAPNTTQLTAVARNDLAGILPAAAVTWSSVGAAATVNGTGLVTAAAVGTAQIIASVATSAVTTLAETTFVTVANAPQTLNIVPANRTLASVGDTAFPQLTLLNAGGVALARTAALWASTATNVATVSNDGIVTALAPGTTTISATSPYNPSLTDSYTVTVSNAPATVQLNQGNVTLAALGATTTYSAVVLNAANDPIGSATVTWDITAGTSITIDANTGLVTAVAVGASTIRARVVGALTILATANVTVTNAPASITISPSPRSIASVNDTAHVQATVRNILGNVISGASVTWSTSNSAIVTFRPTSSTTNNGPITTLDTVRLLATGSGTVTITATAGAAVTNLTVTASNNPATIAITDATPTAPDTLASINDTLVLTVTVDNAQGVALGAAAATWSSSNTGVATAAAGRVIAVGVGTALVRAESPANPAVFDTITVIVTNAPAAVAIGQTGPDTLTAFGQQIVYTATVRNGRNAIIPGAAVAWNSSATGVATINATDGTATPASFSASATGITATSGTIASAALQLFVVNPDTLRVSKDATGAYQFGTVEFPYRTIQAAVNAADPNDVVLIRKAATSYNETLTLATALTLSGANAAGVVCGPATCPDSTTVPVIGHTFGAAAISAAAVPMRLRHLAVAHSTDGPAVDANGASLRADTVYVNPGATSQAGRGILVRNARGNRIAGSRVNRVGGYGIRFENADSSFVVGVTVTNVDTVGGVTSRAGLYATGGDSVFVTNSSFSAAATVADGIRLNDVDSVVTSGNTLASVRYGLRADADVHLVSTNDVFGAATHSCVHISGASQVASLTGATVTGCASAHADSGAVTVNGASARLFVGSSSFTGMDRRIVHFINGRTMWVSQTTMVGTGAPPATAGDTTGGAAVIQTVTADSAVVDSSTVREFRRLRALTLLGTTLVQVDSNLITRNRLGMRFNNNPTTFAVADNDVFDHQDTASARLGAFDLRTQAALDGNWWGDVTRGPAESTFPAGAKSLGDSVDVSGFAPAYTAAMRATPFRPQVSTGTATTIRHLRGHQLTFPTGGSDTVAVRVVDATGRPVQGYDVQFDDASNDVQFTGNVSTITRTTDAAGIARVEIVTITGAAGSRTIDVTPVTTGTPAPISFTVKK